MRYKTYDIKLAAKTCAFKTIKNVLGLAAFAAILGGFVFIGHLLFKFPGWTIGGLLAIFAGCYFWIELEGAREHRMLCEKWDADQET